MERICFPMAVWTLADSFDLPVSAQSNVETAQIVFREDSVATAVEDFLALFPFLWQDILAICIALVLTAGMFLLAWKQKKREP